MKPPTLAQVAGRVYKHLLRFAADPEIAQKMIPGRDRPLVIFWLPMASQSGPRMLVRYVNYQRRYSLTRVEAEAYLEWLDAGNVGTHRKMNAEVALRKVTDDA